MLRLLRVGVHLAGGVVIAGIAFPLLSTARRKACIGRWSARLLDILAVRLHVQGVPPCRASLAMLVANHVSWLDIFTINAAVPARFVAKSEVRNWPVIGWLCARAGTLFIERGRRRDTVRLNAVIAEAMREGDLMAVFPEATTTDGSMVLRFHGALLQSALTAQAAICPVAIRYSRSDGMPCIEAAYDGDRSIWDTLRLLAARRVIHAHLHFLPPLAAGSRHRREVADAARVAIDRVLFPPSRGNRTA
ncbi:MAG: 1-acyl-sn-glycerol-3-phosphate acyltransferase [Burkholderiales bacterium]|nr:1-acyl-sn-glycerol-3-phosphate acyltransferase [Burkholderiales bacterium]